MENGGARLAPEEVARLAEPFRRNAAARTARPDDTGLGPELVLRVRALARRRPTARPRTLRAADVALDPLRHTATRDGRPLDLSPKEFAVLEALLKAAPGFLSAEELLEQVWDEHADPFTNTVAVTIARLRRKLGDPPVIATTPTVGYRVGGPHPEYRSPSGDRPP